MKDRYEVRWDEDVIVDNVVSPPQRGGWVIWDYKLGFAWDAFHQSREALAHEEAARRNALG